jgi:hypothetical protein
MSKKQRISFGKFGVTTFPFNVDALFRRYSLNTLPHNQQMLLKKWGILIWEDKSFGLIKSLMAELGDLLGNPCIKRRIGRKVI